MLIHQEGTRAAILVFCERSGWNLTKIKTNQMLFLLFLTLENMLSTPDRCPTLNLISKAWTGAALRRVVGVISHTFDGLLSAAPIHITEHDAALSWLASMFRLDMEVVRSQCVRPQSAAPPGLALTVLVLYNTEYGVASSRPFMFPPSALSPHSVQFVGAWPQCTSHRSIQYCTPYVSQRTKKHSGFLLGLAFNSWP